METTPNWELLGRQRSTLETEQAKMYFNLQGGGQLAKI